MDRSVLDREPRHEAPMTRARRRRPPPRPAWSCENCLTPNPGRRRRCHDCGTTRD